MFEITIKILDATVMDVLASAFEGGNPNHWIESVEEGKEPTEPKPEGEYCHWSQWWPVADGSVIVKESDPDTGQSEDHELDRKAIKKGLRLMAQGSPVRFGEIVTGTFDAETADLFLQYCLLGKIVYE